jgi:hypothetical protein
MIKCNLYYICFRIGVNIIIVNNKSKLFIFPASINMSAYQRSYEYEPLSTKDPKLHFYLPTSY